MKVVLVKFKDNQRRDFPLAQEKTVIGRGTDCGLRIPARDVSRRHCEIVLASPRPMVNDLGSSNGTFLNGKRVTEGALSPGDRLVIGPVTFLVQIDGKPASIKPEDVAPPKPKAAIDVDDDLLDLNDVDFDLDDAALATDFGDDEAEKPAPKSPPPPAAGKPSAGASKPTPPVKPAPPAKPGRKP